MAADHAMSAAFGQHGSHRTKFESEVDATANEHTPPEGILEIGGVNAQGFPLTYQMPFAHKVLTYTLNAEPNSNNLRPTFQDALEESIYMSRTIFLEMALVNSVPDTDNWTLYHSLLPTDVITANYTRMNLAISSLANDLMLATGPEYHVLAARPISAAEPAGKLLPLEQAIQSIQIDMGIQPITTGRIFMLPTSFMILSDGDPVHPLRTAVLLLAVQPDTTLEPPDPDGPGDTYNYCSTCINCPWWCIFY